jgi:hypothetical protein
MKKETKAKQIVVRFDKPSYDDISEYAKSEHRGLGEFIRHATLYYIENVDITKEVLTQKKEVNNFEKKEEEKKRI